MAASNPPRHLLKLILSCRKMTAQVMNPATDSIVAMASSSEQEFIIQYKAKVNRFPRSQQLWDANVSSRVGDKLGLRLKEAGVSDILVVDLQQELGKRTYYAKLLTPFFHSLEQSGVCVAGLPQLLSHS